LEEALNITRDDLTGISRDVQADLDRFQQDKIKDLKEMLIAYAKAHIRYCQQVKMRNREAHRWTDPILFLSVLLNIEP
jgi:sorting nexin-4